MKRILIIGQRPTHFNPFDMNHYLENSQYLDWQHPAVIAKAAELAQSCQADEQISQRCFVFVRDEIKHSWDYQLNPVTCKASDVLLHGTGYCYAKSHLLAALLRANAIPSGLCYQRLSLDGEGSPYCLHGLNAVYLKRHGWYRIDARGNKPGVKAEFTPPFEQLAFAIVDGLERDFAEILPEPLSVVIDVLTRYASVEDVYKHLPDIEGGASPNLSVDRQSSWS
ncbi:transglutaminase-like domain-containing protein [Methylovulum miyakonense]|uniref:transglutaminase-like domain-containing protein n=1 Tax=Methylovulum miyakonense TaxID=645578 RepID=UPI00036A6532|nr:transglutaminase family protein [Methylovulum miyakonense]